MLDLKNGQTPTEQIRPRVSLRLYEWEFITSIIIGARRCARPTLYPGLAFGAPSPEAEQTCCITDLIPSIVPASLTPMDFGYNSWQRSYTPIIF